MELTINEELYKFYFGVGFAREMDKTKEVKSNGVAMNMGLQLALPKLLMGDVAILSDILLVANNFDKKHLTQKEIDMYLDNVDDIEPIFDLVIEELKEANATKVIVKNLISKMDKES